MVNNPLCGCLRHSRHPLSTRRANRDFTDTQLRLPLTPRPPAVTDEPQRTFLQLDLRPQDGHPLRINCVIPLCQ